MRIYFIYRLLCLIRNLAKAGAAEFRFCIASTRDVIQPWHVLAGEIIGNPVGGCQASSDTHGTKLVRIRVSDLQYEITGLTLRRLQANLVTGLVFEQRPGQGCIDTDVSLLRVEFIGADDTVTG